MRNKIIAILILLTLSGCGDTSMNTTNDSSAFTENNTAITKPECPVCDSDKEAGIAYAKILELAELFIDKIVTKNENSVSDSEPAPDSDAITITISVVNDLVADSIADLNGGADTQETVATFETSLEGIKNSEELAST